MRKIIGRALFYAILGPFFFSWWYLCVRPMLDQWDRRGGDAEGRG